MGSRRGLYYQFFLKFKQRATDEILPLIRIAVTSVANTFLNIIMIKIDRQTDRQCVFVCVCLKNWSQFAYTHPFSSLDLHLVNGLYWPDDRLGF